jgi:hypothetical protein
VIRGITSVFAVFIAVVLAYLILALLYVCLSLVAYRTLQKPSQLYSAICRLLTLIQAAFRTVVVFVKTALIGTLRLASRLYTRKRLGTVATVLIAGITLWPKLVVVADRSLNSQNILLISYEVQNQSYFPLYSAEYTCEPTHMEFANDMRIRFGVGFTAPKLASETLLSNDKRTIICPIGQQVPPPSTISHLDMKIIVRFRVPVMPIYMTRCFRFVTARDETGLRLLPQPAVGECAWPTMFMAPLLGES